jgi:hypothetical protein
MSLTDVLQARLPLTSIPVPHRPCHEPVSSIKRPISIQK